MPKRVELGCPGHFIDVSSCHFRRHTQVGNFRVSTVGDYYPGRSEKRETVGLNRFFETMVFKTSDKQEDSQSKHAASPTPTWRTVTGSVGRLLLMT